MHRCQTSNQNKHKIPHYQCAVQVSSTDKILIDWIFGKCGGTVSDYKPSQLAKNCRKHVYRWQMTSDRLKDILNQVLPYFVIKRRQAEILIEFRNHVDEWKAFSKEKGMNRSFPQHVLNYRESLFLELKSIHCRNYNNSKKVPSGYHD